jgi:hypothetical protein
VLGAGVAHQLQLPVRAARDAIGLLANVVFGRHHVVAIDFVRVAVETAPRGPSTRRGQGQCMPVANQHCPRIERAGIYAHFLARVSRLAQGCIAFEMPIGSDSASLRSSAIAPKLELAGFANESVRRISGAGVIRKLLSWARVALLSDRIVAFIRFPLARTTPRPSAGHLGPSATLAEQAPIVGCAEPLVVDVALASDPWGGPTRGEDRDDDRSRDCGDSRQSSTQG